MMSQSEYHSRRLVLRNEDAAEELEGMAAELGWSAYEQLSGEDEPLRIQWRTAAGEAVRLVEDEDAACDYVFVIAPGRAEAEAVLATVERYVETWSRAELKQPYESAAEPKERGRALLLVALSAPMEFDRETFDIIVGALRSDSADLRAVACYVISYVPYDEFVPVLRDVAENDPEERLRGHAREMLELFAELGTEAE
ncbi:hypothetical protein JOF53_005894 [Crossiella equi]|uniref:HEAT repeat domain-containing protein n=1 Tax=Crossiella equi TaxID=130796 RepID=A0ABS5AKC2_9PSEU|nr:HEAT repeat domain-containing protein [Crossiella equi]MBP2477022.1 hypothetical protein [Crossiella equi]